MTISSPVHSNHIGMTRGVPSRQRYARRAGIVDWSSAWATGSVCSVVIASCVVIRIPFLLTVPPIARRDHRSSTPRGDDQDGDPPPARAVSLLLPALKPCTVLAGYRVVIVPLERNRSRRVSDI